MEETGRIGDLVGLSIQLERNAEALYHCLAQMFAAHPEVASFWTQYADEETSHAKWLENLQNRVPAGRLDEPADPHLLAQARSLVQIPVEQYLQDIHDLQDAFELADELEHSETNSIFELLLVHFCAEENTLPFLQNQLRDHVGRLLMDFPTAYRLPSVRRTTLPG